MGWSGHHFLAVSSPGVYCLGSSLLQVLSVHRYVVVGYGCILAPALAYSVAVGMSRGTLFESHCNYLMFIL